MDRDLSTGNSTRPSLRKWLFRLLISFLLVLGYAFCYFIAPKIEASWTSPGPNGCDLRLMSSVKDVSGIPTAGDSLMIVAVVDQVLHFRIFDGHGKVVVDTDEKKLPAQALQIEDLRKQLESLWPPQTPTRSERIGVNASVTSIVGYTWPGLPGWVIVLSLYSHYFFKYGFVILLVLTAVILLRRWSAAIKVLLRRWSAAVKAKPRRLRFGLGTALATIAIFAVAIAWLNAWLLGPFQAEQHAAAALTRLGGNVVMVDAAPQWLRSYVSEDIVDLRVAAIVDLSHSHVTDADLVYLPAFHHCGTINLSDTQVSNAGLIHLIDLAHGRWLDLSRTRVTDVSILFDNRSLGHPAGLKLSGNRIDRVEEPQRHWCPLHELDLSDTDADDRTLELLPDGINNLSNLDLSGTNVSDEGLLSLLRMEGLTKLNLMDTKVTPAGVARFKSRRGSSRPLLTILTGTRKKAGTAPKNAPPPGTSSTSAQSSPVPLKGEVPVPGPRRP
jgi:hypothetical protein